VIVLGSAVAIAYVIGQAVLVWFALRFVKSFGAFVASHERSTKALLLTHESNLIVHQQNLKMLGELARLQSLTKHGVV